MLEYHIIRLSYMNNEKKSLGVFKKALWLLLLLMLVTLITGVGSVVYNLLYMQATRVGVEAPKVYFIEGSDSGTACTVTIGTNNTWVQISGMKGWPNTTRVYENATAIHNADDRPRNVVLSFFSWSGDTSYAAINVRVYNSNGTQEGGVINVGTEGSNTGPIVIPAGQNFRVQWEIKWAAEATTSHSVSVTLSLRVEE